MKAISRRSLILSTLGFTAGALASGAQTELHPLGCSACDDTISCFEPFDFTDSKGVSHRIYAHGEGPPVLVLHELPGLTPADIHLAKMLIADGYTALVPLLFGEPGDDRFLHYFFSVCGPGQFDCGGTKQTPDAIKWLREFCVKGREKWTGGLGLGVVGMCLTGEFPLALLSDPNVRAAVMCQPTGPFNLLTQIRLGPKAKLSLDTTDIELAQTKSDIPILGLRYAKDPYCPRERFDHLHDLFPSRFYRLDLAGAHHHSSLGKDLCDVAFEEVRLYLGQQLKGVSPIPNRKFPPKSALIPGPSSPYSCSPHNHDCKS
jgi:dienelactone hydrolase